MENEFLRKVRTIIEAHLAEESFGVSELARETGMSRSNLLRKIKSQTKLSVSLFIRQVRLEHAMEMLKESDMNVSEVAFAVGFSSTSYFIKCFREQYGHPPGEVARAKTNSPETGPRGLAAFFQELKRRKVVRVITVYAASAFVILELMSIVVEPLGLPAWTLTLVIVLLAIGFLIAVILSWIYDVRPDGGWEKTRSIRQTGESSAPVESRSWKLATYISFVIIAGLLLWNLTSGQGRNPQRSDLEKSIAVLPFRNDSNDSSNVYLVNGLMESLLDNLQKIEDLRVISRTSVEKYRYNSLTTPEISRELNANYVVEGSGQKIGDQILLNIQLIEGPTDSHLWAEHYKRKTGDIFELQLELAKNIAQAIEAVITPEEAEQIEKIPTTNLEAYDVFLKGLGPFEQESTEGLLEAVPYFQKALELDPQFALAHANLAIAYAFLDYFKAEKEFAKELDYHADQAMLHDPKLPQSLIAKAMNHITWQEYELALPYLEKALEYHPNSSRIVNLMSHFYTSYIPDTEKYLEYALMGINLDISSQDSSDASYTYLHLGNALMQTGFVNEAEHYVELALQYNPGNTYARLLMPYILLARDGDLGRTRQLLSSLAEEHPYRHDILKELMVISFFLHDYQSTLDYYNRTMELTRAQGLDLYVAEKAKIGYALQELGKQEESERYFREYLEYAKTDQSVYRDLSLAAYYAHQGQSDKAIEHMDLFSEQEKYPYWYVLFLGMDDPLFQSVNGLPEFQQIVREIELKFWNYHKEIKDNLEKKGLI